MKKNLRIVSAAAAALLAVAPVAATAVVSAASTTVSAATNTSVIDAGHNGLFVNKITLAKNADLGANSISQFIQGQLGNTVVTAPAESVTVAKDGKSATFNIKGTPKSDVPAALVQAGYNEKFNENGLATYGQDKTVATFTVNAEAAKPADTSSEHINAGNDSQSIYDVDANTNVNISAVAASNGIPSAINGNITYTDANNKSYTALLHSTGTDQNVTVYKDRAATKPVDASKLESGERYWANFNDVTINLGNDMANKSVTFFLPANSAWFVNGKTLSQKLEVTTDRNGVADLHQIRAAFYAYNPTNMQEVHFYDTLTGNVVTSGSQTLHAVNGKVSVQALFATLSQKYAASQLVKGQKSIDHIDTLAPQNDFRDQLKKQNIDVDPNGYFKAPASFSLNLNAKSILNGATASLPVTVNVDNVTPAAAQETTRTVKIMHIATIYDKNGKATHEPALRAYNTVSVVSEPVSLKDEKGNDAGKFYKLAGKDQYIKVGNVDGTSRSLKHNSYVYKSTGKRRGKTVLKKGSSVTTYGKSFMIAGHQMYRIGENQYVKKANF